MSEEKPTLSEVLNKNRKVVIATLDVPIMGMLIAAARAHTHTENIQLQP